MAAGLALDVIGVGFLADGLVNPHGCTIGTCTLNYFEDWFGITAMVVGVTLWAPGAASFVQSERLIRENSQPAPTAPKAALMLSSPVFRF
jgi:hypothetical protein